MKLAITLLVTLLAVSGSSARRIDDFSKSVQNSDSGKTWAVLVAGSTGYGNYRHQADICHAYQILKGHGIPDERIIVFMYDDVANSDENPNPGVLINRPDGPNVYVDVPKDYVGDDVTPENFLKVLKGDSKLKSSGKKVLESSSDDNVFIYYADHGAVGLVAFPSDELYATDLIKTLKQLNKENKYENLLFYIEACESGSMFEELPDELKILGITAANAEEPSWGYYCETDLNTCLGDEFSVKWMEDTDAHPDLNKYTVRDQFKNVKKATELSHVSSFGDESLATLKLAAFQGTKVPKPVKHVDSGKHERILSYDIPLVMAERKAKIAGPNQEVHQQRAQEIRDGREFLDSITRGIAAEYENKFSFSAKSLLESKNKLKHHECYENLVKTYKSHCFNLSKHTYALRSLYVLANVCEQVPESTAKTVSDLKSVIASFCDDRFVNPFSAIV